MNPDETAREEDRFAALFASINTDASVPDAQFLDRLRERSTEVFEAEFSKQAPLAQRRRRKMIPLMVRTLAASAAAAAVIAACFWSSMGPDDAAVLLGTALEKTAQADTLHLELTRDGKTSQVWIKGPQQLRWDEGGGRYKIGRGERLWVVDEAANRATSQASPYFRADGAGIDLLALLELPGDGGREDLLGLRPVDRVQRGGVECCLYRKSLLWPRGRIRVEAVVDIGTQVLRSLDVQVERGGKLEPVVKLTVLALDQPVEEELFVVGETLTEDGRIGKVTDAQGIVAVKPVMRRRWTPVARQLVLKPGDWLRTDVRGANAVKVRLVPETDLTLGPGSLAELARPNRIRLHSGEVKVITGGKTPVKLLGPEQQEVTVKGTQVYRVQDEKLVRLEQEPLWLQGFEGTAVHESIGSLVANVEGRDLPLSVGYHKVTVDIRDQIARTVIEESFANHTSRRLEGVFYFPLPEDASISGFGMWIGDKLVEADVVEKQRAREIYEEILREKRDPGLLEWSGGNLFKARVFPIEPHREKRIKITYTQVLPLRGNRYRYSYGLQSEMLKQHPLRELAIDVKVNSAVPLKSVTSPTHTSRARKTRHSAQVEFAAQEYTPTRDFEVVVELEGRQPEVVMIPHRRGDDGYFMLQLSLPDEGESLQREILPDGKPLDLLILADTSASIDADGRRVQAEFIGSVLSSLTPNDTFNLAACDVDCDWVFKKRLPAEDENVAAARQFLADRTPLGWTDLDGAFASALRQRGPNTQVIYVGDGIVTGKDCDPVAFCNRLERLCQGKAPPLHAVAVGNTFEPIVLKRIASLGGGSVRRISGESGPQAVALELLGEIAKPAVRDLAVQFQGLRAARVYPEPLPNLSAGSQQILLGRYLPEGRDQVGQVIVTGMQGEQPVRFSSQVSLKDAEQGNSFIPRLWARRHLDSLLQQGASQAIQDEIIALSEEYNIMTPYTSLLVLETDEDRERFKVKRRFRPRDGERFFGEGRQNVDYALLQQQMKRAGDWRIGLRRAVLMQLAALGRDSQMLQPQLKRLAKYRGASPAYYYWSAGTGGGGKWAATVAGVASVGGPADWSMDLDGRLGEDIGGPANWEGELFELGGELGAESMEGASPYNEGLDDAFRGRSSLSVAKRELAAREAPAFADFAGDLWGFGSYDRRAGLVAGGVAAASRSSRSFFMGLRPDGPYEPRDTGQYTQWVNSVFPHLPPPPPKEKPKPPEKPWPAPARDLAQSLLRTRQLARMKGGLEIDRRVESFEVRSGRLSSRSRSLMLVSPAAWLIRSEGDRSQTTVQWCRGRERGVLSRAFQLGRLRAASPMDASKPPLPLSSHVLVPLDRTYQTYSVELKPQGGSQTLVVLKHPSRPGYEIHRLVDTARHVVLRWENRQDGEVTSATVFGDFVEAADCWWAGRIETLDKQGRRTSLTTQTFSPVEADAFDGRMEQQLAGREDVQFLREPQVTVADAKEALAAGKATFDVQMALVLHFCRTQTWARVMEHLDQAERLAAGKPGMRWVRNALLDISRRREDLKQRFLAEAEQLGASQPGDKLDSESLFLADHLIGQAHRFLPGIEMLPLVDVLRPVYQRQPAHLRALKGWEERRADYLEQAGRPDEALQLRKGLAERFPHEYLLQQRYARALVAVNEYSAAKTCIDRALARDFAWHQSEKESLRNVWTDSLQSRGRYAELVDYLAGWIKENPENQSAYRQYLSALIRADQEDEADAAITGWLKEAQVTGKLAPAVASRLEAAVSQALGQGHNLYMNQINQRWLAPLAEAALFFARHDAQLSTANRIMGHYRFNRSDECRRVRKAVTGMLAAEVATLSPGQIQRIVEWILPNDPEVEPQVWKRIAAGLQKRWSAESKPEVRDELGRSLVRVLSSRATVEEHLAFLRRRLQEAPKQYRAGYARELFEALLKQPWSADYENEAFALLEQLSDADDAAQRLAVQVGALYSLTDRMVQARFDARMKQVKHQERLTRIELREKQVENLRLARKGFADRLRKEIPKSAQPLAPWMNVERLYLETMLGEKLDVVAAECWKLLGSEPPKPGESDEQQSAGWLDEVLRNRFLMTLLNLAARRSATPALVDRTLAYLDRMIELAPDEVGGKLLKFQLLVALDRPKDLEQSLASWVSTGDSDNRWRRSLGYLAAEQGRLEEAIKLFEAVEAADELGPTDYRALAGWYMAANRREQHGQAMVSVYKSTEEWRLSNWLRQKVEPWRRSDRRLPSELEADVLWAFAALFEKSGQPQNYLRQIQQFYQATHDFRLLACLADAVVGHSAGKVYPFLQGMDSVLSEVRDEATADSIVEHLAEVRKRAETPVDRRALDLLEALVERRAAELLNQPGPHAQKAVAALQRAFKHQWSEGEMRLMADLLGHLGKIAQPDLAGEQVRQLEILHEEQAPGSYDRLHVGHRLAAAWWNYSRRQEATDLLEAAIDEYQDASGGILPANANEALSTFISFLESQVHHARGEKLLFDQLQHPVNQKQKLWLVERLYQLYDDAIRRDGEVSLGSGNELYRAVNRKIQDDLDTDDHDHRRALAGRLCSVYRTANEKKLPGVVDDLKAFAFKRLPEALKRQTNNYQQIVEQVAETLYELAGPRDGLAFLAERLEHEPAWLDYTYENGWSRFSYRMAKWRIETKKLGPDLEEQLLSVVLTELRRDLRTRDSRRRIIYAHHPDYYWAEKETDFRRAAEEVLAERKQSGAAVLYIAEYLYSGLNHYGRAIEILFTAHSQGLLNESAQARLVRFLHYQDRHGESIALLKPLIERRPDNIQYRVWLMHAYFRTGRQEELTTLLSQTDAYFHQEDRWQENAMAQLAYSCLENELFERSVAYYNELIPLHQRTQPRQGVGGSKLPEYYGYLARAYAGLGKTAEAVDAASGAIVSWDPWGPNQGRRHDAFESLKHVLRRAPNLDRYVAVLDQQTAETRKDKPIVRKAVGQIYLEKEEFAKAIAQLKLARQLEPNDAETHKALIACYDKQEDREGAVQQILESLQLSRRDIQQYKDLGQRLEALKQPKEAERAYTSIVEVLPSESESHALLAEVRQNQNRWSDAAGHWRQVAQIRALEPTGLLRLAAAQIHQKQWDEADKTLQKLRARSWPTRFGNVESELRNMERQIEDGRKR